MGGLAHEPRARAIGPFDARPTAFVMETMGPSQAVQQWAGGRDCREGSRDRAQSLRALILVPYSACC